MGRMLKIRELGRDDELGAIKKEISSHDGDFSFESPAVSQRYATTFLRADSIKVNEITRQINNDSISELENGIKSFSTSIKLERLPKKLNATLFNFKFTEIPTDSELRLLSSALYSSSDKVIFLPAVKSSLLQEDQNYSDEKIQEYIEMMRKIIHEIEAVGNGKEFVGMIPLIPPKFARPIVNFYLSEGLQAFAIDANTKDIILNEGDFRVILSEINKEQPLNASPIFAFNLGFPQFEKDEIRSDDFLSVFAYVDVVGGTFKSRGGEGMSGIPRAKIFSRDRYAYQVSTYPEASKMLHKKMNYPLLRSYNKAEQFIESLKICEMLGKEKMKKYLGTKGAVDTTSMKHLESLASNVKIK